MRPRNPAGSSTDRLRDRLYRTLTRTSLPMLFRYEDRNSMAWSIESRVPFLTPALAEFVLSLPEEYLISPDGVTKHVFREAMRGIVPDAILDRRDKIGFATPEKKWLQELGPWVGDTLARVSRHFLPWTRPPLIANGGRSLPGPSRSTGGVWRWVNLVHWAEAWDVRFE